MKITLRLRAKMVPLPEPSTRASTPESDFSSGDTSSASIAVPVESEGSTPMARAELKGDEPITFIQELGMEIEELERFK